MAASPYMCLTMKEKERWLIVGLGNPGQQYARNRHNVGFQCVDQLARAHGLTFTKRQSRGWLAFGELDGRAIILLKPRTFMNDSGRSVAPIARFFRVPTTRLMVIFDELDLDLGSVRLRPRGGSGGHKGMRSVIAELGSEDFPRTRIGIGRPPGRMDPSDYVLRNFSEDERPIIEETYDWTVSAVECWLRDGIEIAMTRFNRLMNKGEPE